LRAVRAGPGCFNPLGRDDAAAIVEHHQAEAGKVAQRRVEAAVGDRIAGGKSDGEAVHRATDDLRGGGPLWSL